MKFQGTTLIAYFQIQAFFLKYANHNSSTEHGGTMAGNWTMSRDQQLKSLLQELGQMPLKHDDWR